MLSSLLSSFTIFFSFSAWFFCSTTSHIMIEWISYSLFNFMTSSRRVWFLPSRYSIATSSSSKFIYLQISSIFSSMERLSFICATDSFLLLRGWESFSFNFLIFPMATCRSKFSFSMDFSNLYTSIVFDLFSQDATISNKRTTLWYQLLEI